MQFLPFFLGVGKIRYWYICFYIIGLPIYVFGVYLLFVVPSHVNPQIREFILTIFTFGYLLLGLVSLINVLLYAKKTGKYFQAFSLFLGLQVIFWMIGESLGNNYNWLAIYFSLFLLIVIFGNLKALSYVKNTPIIEHGKIIPHKTHHKK